MPNCCCWGSGGDLLFFFFSLKQARQYRVVTPASAGLDLRYYRVLAFLLTAPHQRPFHPSQAYDIVYAFGSGREDTYVRV